MYIYFVDECEDEKLYFFFGIVCVCTEFKTLMEQDQILGFNGFANGVNGLQNVNCASKSASKSGSSASAETDNDENKQTDDNTSTI